MGSIVMFLVLDLYAIVSDAYPVVSGSYARNRY